MKTYDVTVRAIVAKTLRVEAEDTAMEIWEEDDEAFTDFGCVHAEESIEDIEEVQS